MEEEWNIAEKEFKRKVALMIGQNFAQLDKIKALKKRLFDLESSLEKQTTLINTLNLELDDA